MAPTNAVKARFWSKVRIADLDACWEWIAGYSLKRCGTYRPVFYLDGAMRLASRVVCTWVHGPAPTSRHEAGHTCDNRKCVNPRHLLWQTPEENRAQRYRS